MGYWLTTHYPHHHSNHPHSVYLKDVYQEKGSHVRIGDMVAFYESKGKAGRGKQGIVAIAEVIGPIRPNSNHDGGPDIGEQRWEWEIPCGKKRNGLVPKNSLCDIMEWSRRWTVRIPGGLLPLEDHQFEQIRRAFDRNR